MRYYVKCRDHPEEKIYVRLGGESATRFGILFRRFTIAFPTSGNPFAYSASDVLAEEGGALPLTATPVGALLFIFNNFKGNISRFAQGAPAPASPVREEGEEQNAAFEDHN